MECLNNGNLRTFPFGQMALADDFKIFMSLRGVCKGRYGVLGVGELMGDVGLGSLGGSLKTKQAPNY